jgi:hypothetical protein
LQEEHAATAVATVIACLLPFCAPLIAAAGNTFCPASTQVACKVLYLTWCAVMRAQLAVLLGALALQARYQQYLTDSSFAVRAAGLL